jgi:hypothetical protein
MGDFGYVSNEGVIPEYRIQLTGTQFELYVVHNAPNVIEAGKFSDITYTIYVPKYVECDMLNWSSLTNVNGDNMNLVDYAFPASYSSSTPMPTVTGGDSDTTNALRLVDVISFSRSDVLTGSILKIVYRVVNGTGENKTLNLVASFRGNMATRKGCAQFKIMGDIQVSQSVLQSSINDTANYIGWQ